MLLMMIVMMTMIYKKFVFSDTATFHMSGTVTLRLKFVQSVLVRYKRGTAMVNVLCDPKGPSNIGPFLSIRKTLNKNAET
jgi:hypothetical protein